MTTTVQPSRHENLSGRDLWIFDDLVQDIAGMCRALDRAPFTRTEVATPESAQYRHWVTEMDLRALANLSLHHSTQQALSSVMPERRYRVYRAYTNYAAYGDVLMVHTDSQPSADEYTALWFVTTQWRSAWGGETLFYEGDDARLAVSPRPGRLVLFHGAIPHAGTPPSRVCFEPRFTFAMKLERA